MFRPVRSRARTAKSVGAAALMILFATSACGSSPEQPSLIGQGASTLVHDFAWLPVPADEPAPLTAIRATSRERGMIEAVFIQADINVVLCGSPPGADPLPAGFCEAEDGVVLRSGVVEGADLKIVLIRLSPPAAEKEVDQRLSGEELEAVTRFWKEVPLIATPPWLKRAAGVT